MSLWSTAALGRGLGFGLGAAACLALLAGACESGDNTFANSGGAGGATSGSSSNNGGATSGTNSGGDGGAGGLVLGPSGSGGGPVDNGCKAVDFLFIVDNSVSMSDQQAALIASFPGFISTIQTTLETNDLHIMVVDTDAETRCTPANCISGAMNATNLCINNPGAANGYACNTTFEACDTTMGAGVIHPAGDGASNQLCQLAGSNRYILQSEPDLNAAFGCVALVGLAGHPSERPMDALVAAMQPDINAPGGCNAGFLREDAILVVTFISDDPNYEDAGVPQDWYDAVVAAKGGAPESVVVLGLTPAFDGCGGNNPAKGAHWHDFIQLWGTHGLEGSVCSPEYTSFFQSAVSIIDEACNEFEPPS